MVHISAYSSVSPHAHITAMCPYQHTSHTPCLPRHIGHVCTAQCVQSCGCPGYHGGTSHSQMPTSGLQQLGCVLIGTTFCTLLCRLTNTVFRSDLYSTSLGHSADVRLVLFRLVLHNSFNMFNMHHLLLCTECWQSWLWLQFSVILLCMCILVLIVYCDYLFSICTIHVSITAEQIKFLQQLTWLQLYSLLIRTHCYGNLIANITMVTSGATLECLWSQLTIFPDLFKSTCIRLFTWDWLFTWQSLDVCSISALVVVSCKKVFGLQKWAYLDCCCTQTRIWLIELDVTTASCKHSKGGVFTTARNRRSSSTA